MIPINHRKKRKQVVNIINPAFQSSKGKFFGGTTKVLTFGGNTNAWARLFNPSSSKVNLFVDFFTLTNLSKNPYSANFFISSKPPGMIFNSRNVGVANTNFNTTPQGKVQFNPSVKGRPRGGVNFSDRRVPGNETVTSGQIGGKVILSPGKSLLFFLTSRNIVKAKIGFAWFEGKTIFK
ncbi:DUF6143 family protein [Chengkuizengella sediminis]|uniref:DUF6143 family protein n=1 Tax=Chengkuizengella sediminis TaxID=1885917 RepID=UPI001389466F|nr:hypothetical protein [Chengkuizengella sediminis]